MSVKRKGMKNERMKTQESRDHLQHTDKRASNAVNSAVSLLKAPVLTETDRNILGFQPLKSCVEAVARVPQVVA